jgi:hypothetical protein
MCLVQGDLPHQIFSVKIAGSQNVDVLEEAQPPAALRVPTTGRTRTYSEYSTIHIRALLALISMHLYPAQTLQLASRLETQAEIFLTLLIKLICGPVERPMPMRLSWGG